VPLRRKSEVWDKTEFGSVRIYLDDIEKIFIVLSQISSNIRIEADDYIAERPSDLAELEASRIRTLIITSSDPKIELEFSRAAAVARVYDTGVAAFGAVAQIDSYLQRRRRGFLYAVLREFTISPGPGSSGPTYRAPRAIVIPRYERDAPTFWQKFGGQVAMNAVFTMIGALLGFVLTAILSSC
jgi:hypothetical protein